MTATVTVLAAAFKLFWVDAFSSEMFLPDADPKGGIVTNELSLAAARGEIETVSFVVNPVQDFRSVDLTPGDLAGPEGAKIAADAVDVALVKAWFRAGGRWRHYWAGDQLHPQLANSLVLHDDSLVVVDLSNKVNRLRIDTPNGPYYADISHRDRRTPFQYDLQNVRDAERFVPMDLKKDFRQQFWITVKVPPDAAPGIYRGEIAVTAEGVEIARLPLSVEVYPFTLPSAKTHYDTSAPYVSYWMGVPNLELLLQGGHDLAAAERKFRNICRSLREHNAVSLSGVGKFRDDTTDDLAVRSLLIARQEGLCARPIVNGAAFGDFGFVWNPAGPLRDPAKEPEAYRKTLDDYRASVERQNAALEKYLGHHECYYQNLDECGPNTSRNCFGYWSIVKERGGMIWADAQPHYDMSFIVDLVAMATGVNHYEASHWHAAGAKITTYAGPFTGAECPDIWRRTKGMRYWYADYDGVHEYNFHEGHNRWNDFTDYGGKYCQFGIVFQTIDGIVPTTAWEGVREGIDDVRYFTLLRRRAEAALASGDPAKVRLGRAALVWQDGIDPERVIDLWAHRRATVCWILKLIDAVGPEPAEPENELAAVGLPPCGTGAELPADAKGLRDCIAKFRAANRYDLALKALEKLLKLDGVPASERVKDAVLMRQLLSAQLRRDEAVAVVEAVAKEPSCTKAERGRLQLEKVNALMTDTVFEERYTREQLDEAARVLVEALKVPELSADERFAAVRRVTEGYLSAGEYRAAIDFATARAEDANITGTRRARLFIDVAEAWKGLGEWQKACKAFDEARRSQGGNSPEFTRLIGWSEAEAAEKCRDWTRAQRCYSELVPCYESDSGYRHRAMAAVARVTKLVRENLKNAEPVVDDAIDISLDE